MCFRMVSSAASGSSSNRSERPWKKRTFRVDRLSSPVLSTLPVSSRWTICASTRTAPTGAAHAPATSGSARTSRVMRKRRHVIDRMGRSACPRYSGSGSWREAGPLHRELHDLVAAEDGDPQGLSRLEGLELLENLGAVVSAGQGDPLAREQDLAPDEHLLAFHNPDSASSLEPEPVAYRILDHLLDEESARLRHVQCPGHCPRHQHGIEPVKPAVSVYQQAPHGVRGDDEAESFAPARLRDVVADDPDQLARPAEHGPARGSRVH